MHVKFNKYLESVLKIVSSDRVSGHFLGCAETKYWQNHDFDTICL